MAHFPAVTEEGADQLVGLGGVLVLGNVTTLIEDHRVGVRESSTDVVFESSRDEPVIAAPHEERWALEGGQAVPEPIVTRRLLAGDLASRGEERDPTPR